MRWALTENSMYVCYEPEEHVEVWFNDKENRKLFAKFKITENDIVYGYKMILTNSYKKITKKPLSYEVKWDEMFLWESPPFGVETNEHYANAP